jgi:DNA-binding response OmpR family regulator
MSTIQTIMLVEDDEKLASLLQTYLSNYGFEVRVVTSGILAVDQIINKPPALLILDLMLPDTDGFH